jgi:AraC-like DNA-binding protein
VARLAKAGVIVRDPAVGAALEGEWRGLTRRSAQRHFLHATGLTQRTHRQIERAREAARRLKEGASIADVVGEGGYFDQAHLTRSLRRWIGEAPARLQRQPRQLSLLYGTAGATPATSRAVVANR